MQPLEIRRAELEDAGPISALIRGVAQHSTIHPDGIGAERFLQTIAPQAIEAYIKSPNFEYLVGFKGQDLAGVVAVRDDVHLFHLFVAPRFRRQGIGRKLWKTVKSAALAAGNNEGFTLNSTLYAVPVYKRFGFETTGPTQEKDGIAFVPMRLALKQEE